MGDDEVRARVAIQDVLATYTFSGDRGRIDELLDAFADDGVLELDSGTYTGHDEIRAVLSGVAVAPAPRTDERPADERPSGPRFLRHHLTSSRIELVAPDEARAWTYFLVMTAIGVDHCGVYVDRLRETDGRWRLVHRRVKVDWSDPRSRMSRPSA